MICAEAETMEVLKFCTFKIHQGFVGFVWRENDLIGFELPDAESSEVEARLVQKFPLARRSALPDRLMRIARSVEAHLNGDWQDWSSISLAYDNISQFRKKVYQVVRQINVGRTLTYGEVARNLGAPGAARAVGMAMRTNPLPLFIPCHRVVAAGRMPGGFTAPGGQFTKIEMLKNEGVKLNC
jgi:methylated-DNA-[protein]-cysteine S-methyltransferase